MGLALGGGGQVPVSNIFFCLAIEHQLFPFFLRKAIHAVSL